MLIQFRWRRHVSVVCQSSETFLTHRCRKIWFGFNRDLFLTHRGIHQHIASQRLCSLNFRIDRICCLLAIDLYLVQTNGKLKKTPAFSTHKLIEILEYKKLDF